MIESFETGEKDEGRRLDLVVSEHLPLLSRVRIQKVIRQGLCRVNGTIIDKPDYRVHQGQGIQMDFQFPDTELQPENGEAKIIWEDNDLVVCDKPHDLVVHPCPSCPQNTLIQRLLAKYPQLKEQGGERPGIVHRLDKDTSGLIVVALNDCIRLKLTEQFAKRKVSKEYLALVSGMPPETGECIEPVGRHPSVKVKMAIVPEKQGGRPARTQWSRIWTDGETSLLRVRIYTGRTHQIRVHLAHLGHPILGDQLYAPEKIKKQAPRQMLHAWRLSFQHPESGKKLDFCAPLPADFAAVLTNGINSMLPVVITGNPGSGKSTLTKAFAARGFPTTSADEIVSQIYENPKDLAHWLKNYMPLALSKDEKRVEKKGLWEELKKNSQLKAEFEKQIHERVLQEIKDFWRESASSPIAFAEIPLYFETGSQKRFSPPPFVIGVHASDEVRGARLRSTREWSDAKIATIDGWQWPEEKKMSVCDLVVANESSQSELEFKADKILKDLLERQSKSSAQILKDVL